LETLNSVKKLLLFLEEHGPGQWVIITNELGKIFPVPEFRFKYSEYAEQIKAFLAGIESEGLVHVKISNQDLYNSAFGDLNNVFCDLEKHDIRAKITKEGLEYIGILGAPFRPMFYLSQSVQLNYKSPGANIVKNSIKNADNTQAKSGISSQTLPDKKESLAEKLKQLAKTIIGAKAILIALFSLLTSLGIFFSLWRNNSLTVLSYLFHKPADTSQKSRPDSVTLPIWPSNLRYIDLDTVKKLSSSDLIFIAWVKGHREDSVVALRLYADMKNAGYKLQQIQELAFTDKTKFKSCQFKLESQSLHDNSRRIQVTINPEFNFLKE
jgi:hypothetical protein